MTAPRGRGPRPPAHGSPPAQGLLATKLFRPAVDARVVSRPRLSRLLDEGTAGPLTLVSAPAGFGKSTLLAHWAAGSSVPVAWLSLDEGDSDPARLAACLAAALASVDPSLGRSVRQAEGQQPVLLDGLLTGLFNEVTAWGRPVVLVLDDCHLIEDPAVFDALAPFLDRLPPELHLVLAGREDPPLPLARYRAGRRLTEVRAGDLRFTPDEAEAFLRGAMGLALDAPDVAALEARTEGWAAGLQLAALSLAGREDAHGFVEAFSGVNRHIVDYLVDEVLSAQTDEVRRFLRRTSILERVSAPLCDRVTGSGDARAMLRDLEARNLFLVPLDDERTWYRYHKLFAGALRQHLDEEEPGAAERLHATASAWFAEHAMTEEALRHALAAGDASAAADLVEGAWAGLIDSSRAQTLWDWTGAVGDDVLLARPMLLVARAWAALLTRRIPELMGLLAVLDRAVAAGAGSPDPATLEAAGHVLAIRSFVARETGDTRGAVELAGQALAHEAAMGPQLRGVLEFTVGWAYLDLGEPGRALPHLEAAGRGEDRRGRYVALMARGLLGLLHRLCGELGAAEAALTAAADVGTAWGGGSPLPVTAYAYAGLGDVAYERGDLAEAGRLYSRASAVAATSADHNVTSQVWSGPVKVAVAGGDLVTARAHLAAALAAEVEQHGPEGRAHVAGDGVRVALAAGDLEEAREWGAAAPAPESGGVIFRATTGIQLWRLAVACGEAGRALPGLRACLDETRASGLYGATVAVLGVVALACDAAGDRDGALAALEEAVLAAGRLGFVRSLLDLGEPLVVQLAALRAAGRSAAAVDRLLARAAAGPPAHARGPGRLGAGVLPEPLTAREAEVLRLMADGASYESVARELFVSVNTVRHHVKSLYRKLEVNSRAEAVARARRLGLL